MGSTRTRFRNRCCGAYALGATFSESDEEKLWVVDAAYLEQHVRFVRDPLKRAGIRLGIC